MDENAYRAATEQVIARRRGQRGGGGASAAAWCWAVPPAIVLAARPTALNVRRTGLAC